MSLSKTLGSHLKLIHRIVITRKELLKFGINKTGDECLYCGNKDSIEHTFIDCPFTESFEKKVIQWSNEANCCHISPTTKELLFGIPSSKETKLIYKFNYTTLAMRYYIYLSNKINSKGIYMDKFINKLSLEYNVENIN